MRIPRTARAWGALAALVFALSPAVLALEVEKKKDAKRDEKKDEKKEEAKKPLRELPRNPKEAKPPQGEAPARDEDPEIRHLALRLADWESARSRLAVDGLEIDAFIAPDALVYRAAATYLSLRRKGSTREAALRSLNRSLARWKRYDGASLLVLRMKNGNFKIGETDRRVYTQQKNLSKEAIRVRAGSKLRLPGVLAGNPRNLRLAKLRVKKFWKTSDGLTRRARPRSREELLRDPTSIGRGANYGTPFQAIVLEEKTAEVEILLKRRHLEKSRRRSFQVELPGWKLYEGPWRDNILDLNERRTWKEVPNLELDVSLPPSGLRVSPELQALLDAARDPKAAK